MNNSEIKDLLSKKDEELAEKKRFTLEIFDLIKDDCVNLMIEKQIECNFKDSQHLYSSEILGFKERVMWWMKGVYDCVDLESTMNVFDSSQNGENLVEFSVIAEDEQDCLEKIKNHIIENVFGSFSNSRLKVKLSEEVKSQVIWYEELSINDF